MELPFRVSLTQHLYVIWSKLILQFARSTPAHISVFSLILASVAVSAMASPPIAVADWLPARVDQWKPIGFVAIPTPVPYPVPFNSSAACPPGNPYWGRTCAVLIYPVQALLLRTSLIHSKRRYLDLDRSEKRPQPPQAQAVPNFYKIAAYARGK